MNGTELFRLSATEYVLLAYAIGLGLLWGHGVSIWLAHRVADRRRKMEGESS